MMIAIVALLALGAPATLPSAPANLPASVTTCFGPCYVPGCPNSTFWVCHETPGKTTVMAQSGGAKLTSTHSNDATFGIGVLGATIQPASPGNWGSVDSCGDILGDC